MIVLIAGGKKSLLWLDHCDFDVDWMLSIEGSFKSLLIETFCVQINFL